MLVLCDTCSVLMLIRIAPDMFLNSEYECVTIKEVHEEFFRTTKFKEKYPWRTNFKSKIKCLGTSEIESDEMKQNEKYINQLSELYKNKRTDKFFDLSRIDKKIAACVLTKNYNISSVDRDLNDFMEQQFEKKAAKPLALINVWLKKQIFSWDDFKQTITQDWGLNNEAAQDKKDIQEFERLSNYIYIGS